MELILGGGGGRVRRGTEKEGSTLSSYRNGEDFLNLVNKILFQKLHFMGRGHLDSILGSHLIQEWISPRPKIPGLPSPR